MDETSWSLELLTGVRRDDPRTLGAQLEDQLRDAVRSTALRPGTNLPSTRDLAGQLGISRRIVVDTYAQLAAEGYLQLRQGARPRVAVGAAAASRAGAPRPSIVISRSPFDFRPSAPDVSVFPRSAWLRSVRHALATMTDADLGYGDPRGVDTLRAALADYLGRVRGVIADPHQIVITNGFTQSLGLLGHALAASGARRIATEDPSDPETGRVMARAGLDPFPIPVDGEGLKTVDLDGADVDAVLVTPAHQHPTGAVLSGPRRTALSEWLKARTAYAIEDDYDAEYRYDRAAVGALQGLDPDRVVYAGSASKTLAPALRIGWLIVPPSLLDAVVSEKVLSDRGTARIEQAALADFLARGELDRHLRRMRARYRRRRDALVEALAAALPEATVRGAAAGLHLILELPAGDDEGRVQVLARGRGVELETLGEYRTGGADQVPTLLLGYGQLPETAVRDGVREVAAAVRAARATRPS